MVERKGKGDSLAVISAYFIVLNTQEIVAPLFGMSLLRDLGMGITCAIAGRTFFTRGDKTWAIVWNNTQDAMFLPFEGSHIKAKKQGILMCANDGQYRPLLGPKQHLVNNDAALFSYLQAITLN